MTDNQEFILLHCRMIQRGLIYKMKHFVIQSFIALRLKFVTLSNSIDERKSPLLCGKKESLIKCLTVLIFYDIVNSLA